MSFDGKRKSYAIYLAKHEFIAIQTKAKLEGIPMAVYVRQQALKAARNAES